VVHTKGSLAVGLRLTAARLSHGACKQPYGLRLV